MIQIHGECEIVLSWTVLLDNIFRTTAFDKNAQMDKPLTAAELDLIRRLQENENPDADYNPYEPTVEWFTGKGKEEIMPLSAAPEPKRRWVPSKWEKQKVSSQVSYSQPRALLSRVQSIGYEDSPCYQTGSYRSQ